MQNKNNDFIQQFLLFRVSLRCFDESTMTHESSQISSKINLCSEDEGLMDFDRHKGVNLWQNFHFLFRCSSFYFHLPLWVNHKNHNHPLGLWLCFMIENGILDNIFTLRYKKEAFLKANLTDLNRLFQTALVCLRLFETIGTFFLCSINDWNFKFLSRFLKA